MCPVRFDGQPPPSARPEPTYPVLRPQKHGPLEVTLLSNTVRSVALHWSESDETGVGESVVCTIHDGACLHHDDPLEWSGWLPVYDHKERKKSILRLGPKDCGVMLRAIGTDVDWQYKRVVITPVNRGEGRTITCVLATEHLSPAQVAPFDMTRTLCLVLRCAAIPRQTPPEEAEGAEGGAT